MFLACLAFAGSARAAGDHAHGAPAAAGRAPGAAYAAMSPFACSDAALACATAATPAWAADGGLWLAWVAGGTVSVARSDDGGRSFGPPRVIGRHGSYADIGPDARPQVVVDREGRILVFYAIFKDEHWNAQVLVSRSVDGGRSFSEPRPVTADGASQRFPSVALDEDGSVFVAWIDKRLVAAAARQGRKLQGASIAYAWSNDGGASFTEARIAHAESCECCRIGATFAAPGRPAVVFRDVFEQRVRDHAMLVWASRDAPGPLHRVAVDDWATDACPHHGPALAIDAGKTVHAAWFTQGRVRSGTFYARATEGGRAFSPPMRVGGDGARAMRPHLLATRTRVWLAWKAFDGKRTTVFVQHSADGGQSWSDAQAVLSTAAYSDHPLLVARDGQAHLSWLTHDDGYRMVPLETR